MRAKVLTALLFTIALLAAAAWLTRGLRSATPSQEASSSPPPVLSTASGIKTKKLDAPEKQPVPASPKPPGEASTEDDVHAQKVRQRIAELNELAMSSDTNSLNTILSELTNPDKEIRKGALEATIQFADRAAIPRLQEIADNTKDMTEKTELLEAIEYLKLPSLTEYLRQKEKAR